MSFWLGLELNSAWRWSRTKAEEPYLRITPMHKWTVFIAKQESESEYSYFKSNCYRTTGSFHCCNLEKLNHSLNAFACLQHFLSSRILRHRLTPWDRPDLTFLLSSCTDVPGSGSASYETGIWNILHGRPPAVKESEAEWIDGTLISAVADIRQDADDFLFLSPSERQLSAHLLLESRFYSCCEETRLDRRKKTVL